MTEKNRGYPDLHEHLAALDQRGLLLTIDGPIDKDAELHPLVRWQFVGGIEEHERKAFLFTNVVDGRGRKYAFPVVVGALRGKSRDLLHRHARASRTKSRRSGTMRLRIRCAPRVVTNAACQEVVIEGAALQGRGHAASTACRSRSRRRVSTARRR